jgi:hypothetical protein
MIDVIIGVMSASALGIAGWAFQKLIKVESLEEKVDHIRQRVDALYDHLLDHDR